MEMKERNSGTAKNLSVRHKHELMKGNRTKEGLNRKPKQTQAAYPRLTSQTSS